MTVHVLEDGSALTSAEVLETPWARLQSAVQERLHHGCRHRCKVATSTSASATGRDGKEPLRARTDNRWMLGKSVADMSS